MYKILILGASGLLGKSLVDYFVFNNFKVGALSRTYAETKNELVNSYAINVLDYDHLEAVIAEYDVVVNCIGQVTNPINGCVVLNSLGMKNIIDAVKKHDSYLIHFSTVSVYGNSPYVTEDSPVNPETTYATIKYFAEFQICQSLENFTILRVSNLYGKGQTKGILGYISRSYYENKKEIFFNNDGSLKRYYLHIDDLSAIVETILTNRLKVIYNVIGNDFLTIKQLVTLFERIFNYSFSISYEPKKPIENIENIDNSKVIDAIAHSFKNDVESYLKGIEK